TRSASESPMLAAGRSVALTFSEAKSRSSSRCSTSAGNTRPSHSSTSASCPRATWALVMIKPSALQMTPEPLPGPRPRTCTVARRNASATSASASPSAAGVATFVSSATIFRFPLLVYHVSYRMNRRTERGMTRDRHGIIRNDFVGWNAPVEYSQIFRVIPQTFRVITCSVLPSVFLSLKILWALANGHVQRRVVAAAQHTHCHRLAHAIRPQHRLHIIGVVQDRTLDAEQHIADEQATLLGGGTRLDGNDDQPAILGQVQCRFCLILQAHGLHADA